MNFVVPNIGTNVYTLRLQSTVSGEYAVVTSEDITFESEPNNGAASPLRNFDGQGKAMGYVSTEPVVVTGVVEPDNFPAGTSLNTAVQGVTLSIVGSTAAVTPAVSTLAPTGTQVFSRNGVTTWGSSTSLRADFAALTDQVSITAGSDDSSDVTFLRAFSAANVMLAEVTSAALTMGQSQVLTITRASKDIAYITAGGLSPDVTILDKLTFNSSQMALVGDLYQLHLVPGQSATMFTDTPLANSSLASLNDLNPSIVLIGPNGQPVASDANSRDGKNAQLPFTATVGGVYLVQIQAESGAGAYLLNVTKGPLPADFDIDGDVDGADFLAWQRGLRGTAATHSHGDANGDGAVDALDLVRVREEFGQSESVASQVTTSSAFATSAVAITAADFDWSDFASGSTIEWASVTSLKDAARRPWTLPASVPAAESLSAYRDDGFKILSSHARDAAFAHAARAEYRPTLRNGETTSELAFALALAESRGDGKNLDSRLVDDLFVDFADEDRLRPRR